MNEKYWAPEFVDVVSDSPEEWFGYDWESYEPPC